MAIGFVMVWKSQWFIQSFGDLGSMVLGLTGYSFLSWKLFGMILMVLGFLLMTGLLDLFLRLTIGRLLIFGGI